MQGEDTARTKFYKWLSDRCKKSTFKSYKQSFEKFLIFYDKTATEILAERKRDSQSEEPEVQRRFDYEIEKFYRSMIDKGFSVTTARTNTLGIVQFFRYFGLQVMPKIPMPKPTGKSYIPKIEELRRMYQVANLKERLVLSLGLDLGWRINDFIKIKVSDLPDLNQETPIAFSKVTEKETALSSTFISKETVEILKAYLPTLHKENPYLLQANVRYAMKDESINAMIHRLSDKAQIKVSQGKRFTFHSLRKRVLSTCASLQIDLEYGKLLVGKTISKADETYLGDANLRDAFIKIRENALSLTNGTVKSELEMKDKEIAELKKQVEELNLLLRGMSKVFGEEILKKAKQEQIDVAKHTGEPLTPIEALKILGRREKEKSEREYQRMIEETNGISNNETETA